MGPDCNAFPLTILKPQITNMSELGVEQVFPVHFTLHPIVDKYIDQDIQGGDIPETQ
jgi:hypothetical protein